MENFLFEYPQKIEVSNLSDEDLVQFVRKVAEYVGEVLAIHADGKWEPLAILWSTHIVFEGGLKITKGGRQRTAPSVVCSLGNIGTAVLGMISIGKKPLLY